MAADAGAERGAARRDHVDIGATLIGAVADEPPQPSRGAVADGGVKVPGWQGKVDAGAEKESLSVKDAKFAPEGSGFRVTTGPATAYWNPKNVATGDYTVSATFTEPKFMNLNDHPHPYGIVIAGNDMGTGQQSYIYCAAYGNGNFIVRGFGPDPFQLNGRREASDVRDASRCAAIFNAKRLILVEHPEKG